MAGSSRGNPFDSEGSGGHGNSGFSLPTSGSKLKRDKRSIALYLKEECTRANDSKPLNDYLDSVCDPQKPIDDPDTIDWYKWIIAGGMTYDEFGKKVRDYDGSVMCGLVWTANFVAYRCRTCGISPCMSICSDCFQAGNHEGHDYNMFRSQAGGACDCGDTSVMKSEGFCPKHGDTHGKPSASPPQELMAIPNEMMSRLFLRLLFYLREHCAANVRLRRVFYMPNISDLETYLNFLQSLSDMGAAMRRVMTQALVNEDYYKKSTDVNLMDKELKNYAIFLDELKKRSEFPSNFGKYKGRPGLSDKLEYRTIMEELLFWVVHFEFPQRLVTFLLGLLPDDLYKEAFSKAFVKHYYRISMVLMEAKERTTVANRIVHISVQLFSNEQLAVQLTEDYSLLLVIILSLGNMIQDIRVPSILEDLDMKSNFHAVVNCEHEIMKDHCYWPVVSDLINVLSHGNIALKFLHDPDLMVLWLELLTDMQGMNVNTRELSQHVEFEPDTYYAAFSAELEISASPMWSLLMHCQAQETCPFVLEMIKSTISALEDWFESINFTDTMKPVSTQLTFHLPLHRYLSMFIMTAVNVHGVELSDLLPEQSSLKMIMMHALQIQVCLTQIYAGMWVRNGIQIKGQAMTYIQCHFCYSMSDADIFLLQICASKLDPDFFVQTVIERYQIMNWLSYSTDPVLGGSGLDQEHELAMVEGALNFFCSLFGMHTYLGMNESELMRKEMASLLCMNDRQHSTLLDLMPEKTGVSGWAKELFEPTLKELAEYKSPDFESSGGLQQGTYVPKASVWDNDFDPVHVSQRAIYRRDMQSAMDRYSNFVRTHKNYKKKNTPWPPFLIKDDIKSTFKGIYRLLSSKVMHAFLFNVLHKSITLNTNLPENIPCYAVHLLDLCIHHSTSEMPPINTKSLSPPAVSGASVTVPDIQLGKWFTSADVRLNACTVIGEVTVLVDADCAASSSTNQDVEMSSLEELFQISPSTMMSSTGPITSAQMGHMPVPAMVPIPSISSTDSGSATSLPLGGLPMGVPLPQLPGQSQSGKKMFESRGMTTCSLSSKKVSIKESLVSVLIKLHTKLAGSSCYKPCPVTLAPAVGDGAYYISRLLDKFYAASPNAKHIIDESCRVVNISKSKGGPLHNDKDSKRRKAWNRQQKLMAEFASKQKSFLEQSIEEGHGISEGESASSERLPSSEPLKEYDCVICGQSTPSTKNRLVGLVVFLQASSVLGHRHQKEQENVLTLSDSHILRHQKGTCGKIYKRKFEALQKNFEEKSCELSVNIGWEGGVVARTCGHYLHLDCHQSYLQSLQTQNQSEVLAVNKREYWCPLCRQLSNAVVPIVPEDSLTPQTRVTSDNPVEIVTQVSQMMEKPHVILAHGNSSLSSAMSTVMEDLTNITYPSYRTFSSTPNTESVLLFIASLIRTNLEVELLQRGGNLICPPIAGAIKKHCLVPLFNVLSQHCRVLVSDCTYRQLLHRLTGLSLPGDTNTTSSEKCVPLLLKDPLSILIQFVLTLANNLSPEHLDCLIQVFYNMVYTQALVYLSLKFSSEERDAWRKKGRQSQTSSIGGSLSHVINWLSRTTLYEEETGAYKLPAICQSVWSPQGVEQTVQEFCLPYMRIASLVKQHLFNNTIQETEEQNEFQFLSTYLCLGHTTDGAEPSVKEGGATSTSCLHWLVEESHTVMRNWCTTLANYINANSAESKMLLQINPNWQKPSLIKLPKRYYQIFQMFRTAKCSVCKRTPKDPAICLICGQFVCFREICCSQNSVFESVLHSIECGAGTGIFLLVNSSIVIVIRGPRATPWGSVYLDEHGEEDRDLKRGKPLFLSSARFGLLESQWLTHSFDHSCKRWIWHRDQL